jgi:NADH:ubiquinone oxidoreductase subunit F (NADH-binding)/ferredoxin
VTTLPGIPVRRGELHVRVDASRCTGHGVCVEVAPTLFALDRFGFAYVRPEVAGLLAHDADARVLAREAAVRCPDDAILVDRVAPREEPRPAPLAAVVADPGPARDQRRLLADGFEDAASWRAAGGFGSVTGTAVTAAVREAGLRGQGGARFPVTAKWRAVGRGAAVVVANGAEREPGTVKDRHLLAHRPFAVLDGLRLVARATGAPDAIVAVDADQPAAWAAMEGAVAATATDPAFAGLAIVVRAVPPRYVAGEETALLRALEDAEPLPRVRPPFPTTSGWRGRPTVVHNVETLVQVALIAAHGAAWFRALGTPDDPGTGLFSVSRFGGEAALVERPYGTPLLDALVAAGFDPATAGAVVVGGWSGGLLPMSAAAVPLADGPLRDLGAALGTKSLQVLGPDDCVVDVAARVVSWFGAESAGQCPPCRDGLPWIAGVLADLERGIATAAAVAEARAFAETLPGRGACALPDGAVRFVRSLFRWFGDDVDAHVRAGCPRR